MDNHGKNKNEELENEKGRIHAFNSTGTSQLFQKTYFNCRIQEIVCALSSADRACGFEPQGRGFKSLRARKQKVGDRTKRFCGFDYDDYDCLI